MTEGQDDMKTRLEGAQRTAENKIKEIKEDIRTR